MDITLKWVIDKGSIPESANEIQNRLATISFYATSERQTSVDALEAMPLELAMQLLGSYRLGPARSRAMQPVRNGTTVDSPFLLCHYTHRNYARLISAS